MLSIFITFEYRISHPHSKLVANYSNWLDVKFTKSSMGKNTIFCITTFLNLDVIFGSLEIILWNEWGLVVT